MIFPKLFISNTTQGQNHNVILPDNEGMAHKRSLKNWNLKNYDALRDLVPSVKFKKREKHP